MSCPQCAEVVWRLECTDRELEDLKRQRREDAKANEKVASIYATQEQTWFGERSRLRLQIAALLNQLGIFEKRRAECVESLTGRNKDLEELLTSNKRMMEEEVNRSKELDEKLKKLEESVAAQVEEHAAEALRSKTAFVKLVSSHRQLEAELCRAFRQVELGKNEVSLILEQKDEAVSMVQKLSLEVVKLRKEAEQKEESVSQKQSITSMWYNKHGSSRIKLRQTQSKTSEQENLEQRHRMEVNSLVEQLRVQDEKLEIFHWRLLSTEIKCEQLRAHVDGLKQDKAQLTQTNLKLEEQVHTYEADLHYLNKHLEESINERKPTEKYSDMKTDQVTEHDNGADHDHDGVWMDVKEVTTEERMQKKKSTNCSWKMDVQALGVFHKVKRLKQQLLMLERCTPQLKLVGGKDDKEAFTMLMSLLNKQVCRYESLQARIDDLCNRMNEESDRNGRQTQQRQRKTREEIKALERYLQEVLQLQRYMVASGQKLNEIQNGLSGAFCNVAVDEVEKTPNMDMGRFACSMRDVLKEVQKGLEVQSSRIIGDLEGTLACDGMEQYT